MDILTNQLKRALQAGSMQIGLWSSLSSHITVEVIAGAGFDWLLLDTEHSPNELTMVQSQLQAMTGGTATPVVLLAVAALGAYGAIVLWRRDREVVRFFALLIAGYWVLLALSGATWIE